MRALLTFLAIDGPGSKDWINAVILRLVFQNMLIEQNESVLSLSLDLWNSLLDHSAEASGNGPYSVSILLEPHIDSLLTLLMTPIGSARTSYKMDTTLMIKPSGAPIVVPSAGTNGSDSKTNGKRKRKSQVPEPKEPIIPVDFEINIDSPMLNGDVTLVDFSTFLRTRITSAKAYGRLMALWDPSSFHKFSIVPYLSSAFSTQCLFLESFWKNMDTHFLLKTQ